MIEIPTFETKEELYKFLVDNRESLTAQKMSTIKEADGFGCSSIVLKGLGGHGIIKSDSIQVPTSIKARLIINTTKIMDSHDDVHIDGLWNKSVKENKRILHVQEHRSNEFNKIISSGEDLKVSVKNYTWKELGYDAEGETEALVFDSNIKQERNPFMFDQYLKGYVNNHSVGMRYIKLGLAINNDNYVEEKALWDEVFPMIVNSKHAEKKGYFWAVKEAMVLEGSSVPLGSNPITPTLEMTPKLEEIESGKMLAIKAFLNIK